MRKDFWSVFADTEFVEAGGERVQSLDRSADGPRLRFLTGPFWTSVVQAFHFSRIAILESP